MKKDKQNNTFIHNTLQCKTFTLWSWLFSVYISMNMGIVRFYVHLELIFIVFLNMISTYGLKFMHSQAPLKLQYPLFNF